MDPSKDAVCPPMDLSTAGKTLLVSVQLYAALYPTTDPSTCGTLVTRKLLGNYNQLAPLNTLLGAIKVCQAQGSGSCIFLGSVGSG